MNLIICSYPLSGGLGLSNLLSGLDKVNLIDGNIFTIKIIDNFSDGVYVSCFNVLTHV